MCCICLGRLWVSKLLEQMRRKGGACWRSRTGFGLPKRRYKFRISEKAIKSESNSDDKLKKQKEKVKVDKLEKESFQVATTLTENRIPSPGLRWDEQSQDLMC